MQFLLFPSLTFMPPIKDRNEVSTLYNLANLSYSCTVYNSKNDCPSQIFDMITTYHHLLYVRDSPYTAGEYLTINKEQKVITDVEIILNTSNIDVDIYTINESYSITVTADGITVQAPNAFAAAHAFATLIQLVKLDQVNNRQNDTRYYMINHQTITDRPAMVWRHFHSDACSHFMTLDDIKRIIDATSIQKLNVLMLTVSSAYSFPLQLTTKPANRLVFGSYSPYHYYSKEEMQDMQQYAIARGVIIVPEVSLPARTYSWQFADKKLIANCPDIVKRNPNDAVLNPLYDKTKDYVKAAINDIVEMFFPDFLRIRPILYLGGYQINYDCWRQDESIQDIVTQVAGLTYQKLASDFHLTVVQIAKNISKDVILVFNEDISKDDFEVTNDSIIYYTHSQEKQWSNRKNLNSIQSTNWDLSMMHPNGGFHYFWQETYMDINRMDPRQGLNGDAEKKLGLGGGVVMPGYNCYARSCEQHSFDRGLGIPGKLWGQEFQQWVGAGEMQELGCIMAKAGIGTGPLDIGAPCVGYPTI